MISCIIVEDQPPAQRILKTYIQDISSLELKGIFGDALSALQFLKQESVDLIFLDIHLPKISGLDFLTILNPKPKIILTTAFSDYALQSYELDVTDYLLKPFSFERFVKAISKILQLNQPTITKTPPKPKAVFDFVFIKSGHEFLKIKIPDIQYIKSYSDYTQIFTTKKRYTVSQPLKHWCKNLPLDFFCQIHKSYVINIHFIDKVVGNQVLIGNAKLPIGRTFKEAFFRDYLVSFE